MQIKWVLENQLMPQLHQRLQAAAENRGHAVRFWKDDWEDQAFRPKFKSDQFVMFHGSLGVANDIAREGSLWTPGAFCNTDRFACSDYYQNPAVRAHLIHQDKWQTSTVEEFVAKSEDYFQANQEVFVRPDSCLKPFSGRVLSRDKVSLRALDHGFYYDDLDLPILITPTRAIQQEWRFIVHDNQVITGSGYFARGRQAALELTDPGDEAWSLAQTIAETLKDSPPDPLYILDIAESDGELWLMELGPFSGADLYSCNMDRLVEAMEKIASKQVFN